MIKLTNDHVNAVSAAATSRFLQVSGKQSPVFRRLLKKEAHYLIEVKQLLEKLVAEPQFLCLDDVPEDINPVPEKPRDNGTASKSNGY